MMTCVKQNRQASYLFIISFIILFLSFQYNAFHTVGDQWFKKFQQGSEALVIGKLVKSRSDGVLKDQGRLGRYFGIPDAWIEGQSNLYLERIEGGKYKLYNSQVGLQGMFFSTLDKFLNSLDIIAVEDRIEAYHIITAIVTALVISLIILLFYYEITLFPSLLLLISVVFSKWIVAMADNLYWQLWLMYLPFLTVFIFYKYEEAKGKGSLKLLCLLVFLAILIRSLNGYEYLSTILIAMVSPIIYFAVKNSWSYSLVIRRFFWLGLSGVFGFLAALSLHILQLQLSTKSFAGAWDKILNRIMKRTHGHVDNASERIEQSINSSVFEVIQTYFNGTAIELKNLFGFKVINVITYGDLTWVFLLTTIFSFTTFKNIQQNYNRLLALVAATWFSLLAPLSWFILAKGHSYIHTHINYILWHLPYTIFGFALLFIVLYLLLKDLYKFNKYIAIVLTSTIVIIITTCFISNTIKLNRKTNSIFKDIVITNKKSDFNIYLTSKNQLIYYIPDCKITDVENKFFLHLYPVDQKQLKHQDVFNKYDFKWSNHAIEIPVFSSYGGGCLALKHLPKYPIKSIRTGQYSGSSIFWQEYIELEQTIDASSNNVIAHDLTNETWQKGISRSKAAFFVVNNSKNSLLLQQNSMLNFAFSGQRKIIKITITNKYINVVLKGAKLNPDKDGYPNEIKVITVDLERNKTTSNDAP